jgi:hypothetical protein
MGSRQPPPDLVTRRAIKVRAGLLKSHALTVSAPADNHCATAARDLAARSHNQGPASRSRVGHVTVPLSARKGVVSRHTEVRGPHWCRPVRLPAYDRCQTRPNEHCGSRTPTSWPARLRPRQEGLWGRARRDRHVWAALLACPVETAHGQRRRQRRLTHSFEDTLEFASGWPKVDYLTTVLASSQPCRGRKGAVSARHRWGSAHSDRTPSASGVCIHGIQVCAPVILGWGASR